MPELSPYRTLLQIAFSLQMIAEELFDKRSQRPAVIGGCFFGGLLQ